MIARTCRKMYFGLVFIAWIFVMSPACVLGDKWVDNVGEGPSEYFVDSFGYTNPLLDE